MKILIKKVAGLQIPSRAKKKDAAYDIVATTEPVIVGDKIPHPMDGSPLWKRVAYIEYGTNIFIAPEERKQLVAKRDIQYGFTKQDPNVEKLTWETIGIDYHTIMLPRSSASRYNLVLANSIGTIDNGYRDEIKLRFKYMFQPEDFIVIPEAGGTRVYGVVNRDHLYNQGDKVIQIKASANVDIEWVLVDELPPSDRGTGGFGSTGN